MNENMKGIMEVRNHLLQEFELAVRTSSSLIRRIESEQWSYQPKDNMRSLLQLVHHIVTIPATDLAIMREKSLPEVEQIEKEVEGLRDPEELIRWFEAYHKTFRTYMMSLSEDELLNKSTKAFYLDQGSVQIKWLIETVTHSFHHRSQLYNYLKQIGHELHFAMLYE